MVFGARQPKTNQKTPFAAHDMRFRELQLVLLFTLIGVLLDKNLCLSIFLNFLIKSGLFISYQNSN